MKQNIHHPVSARQSRDGLYYLFYPRELISLRRSGWIIIVLLLFNSKTSAQETPSGQDKFYIGTEFQNETLTNLSFYPPFYESGMNTILQRADENTLEFIWNYNILAANSQHKEDWIHHYTTGYYSKWEAEENQTESARVGIKHYDSQGNTFGEVAFWDSAWCWSTKGLTNPACSLMYGPHYRQDTRYKRWLYDTLNLQNVRYVPRFRMALSKSAGVLGTEDVCEIKVIHRYKKIISEDSSVFIDDPFLVRTLKVQDFDSNGEHTDFNFQPQDWYKYPLEFILPAELANFVGTQSEQYPQYINWESYTGIQFRVEWLREDTLCTLYIDYVEVYDNNGWNDFIDHPDETALLITDYAQDYETQDWQNIKHWVGVDEPYSIDCYTPIRIVDSLIQTVNPSKPLIVAFNPTWTWNHNINGEDEVLQFYNRANPKRITLSVNPCDPRWSSIRKDDFDWLQFNLQRTSALDNNFWFNAQTMGYKRPNDNGWCTWRKPDSLELRSMVMLALAHGTKGIIFKWFDSYYTYSNYCAPNELVLADCIVDTEAKPTSLYNEIKNNLAPRLTGKLGNTLKDLNYTGDFIPLYCDNCPNHDSPTFGYLTIDCEASNYHWHAGFFRHKNYADNEHFFLTNLRTFNSVTARLTVSNNTDYENVSFTDIEGGVGRVDTTVRHNLSLTYSELMPPGEGRLYRVSPVIKYGGRLLYPESTESGMILNDDMIIENGAVLTVNGVYFSKGNITIKSGGIINGDNGQIHFDPGKKLIIEGSGSITGTTNNKIDLEFSEPINEEPTGIMIKANGSLTISNCKIENATIGINSLLNANYLNAQNVEFINCETHSINIAGRNPGMNPTPPPQITGCTILNSNYGIAISNLPGMLIFDNDLTNTACGIYLSNVTDAQIIGNTIISNREEYPGLWIFSSGGAIRTNFISGHTNGVHFANSAMVLGSNYITENKFHGLYIGDGSLPYMRQGQWIGIPPNMYATSGYSKIFQNGGYEGEGDDNDGSEIYFVNSNAEMDKGCNRIYDDRQPLPPLVNTVLLMSCPEEIEIEVDARMNYWGSWIDESRFSRNLIVEYIPYSETPCPEPQDGSEGELVRMTSFGDVIDTVYAVDIEIPELTETEEAYAEAEEYFLTGNLANALQIYVGIISSTATDEEKYLAYQRKYSIGKLTGQSTEYFNQLSNTFAALSSNTQDTLNKKIFNQLSTLSKVGEQEYETAIAEFDNIVQQNPNTEEAVYAEIDALTTALLLEEADTTLQKGRLGKYLIKSAADYNQRIDEILRKHFGSESKENQKEIIPTEYTLYQNYPNPFNPVTTIKYDLPNTSDVSLIIYDILGRKVKELVNTKQQVGRYEIQFDASNLASGVYVYQLIADKYINSKKMILLK